MKNYDKGAMESQIYLFWIEVRFRRDSRYVRRLGNVLVIAEDMDRVLSRCGRQIRNVGGSIAIIIALDLRFGRALDREAEGTGLTVCVHRKFRRMADDAGAQAWSERSDVGFLVRTNIDLEGRLGNFLAAICNHHHVATFLNRRIMA